MREIITSTGASVFTAAVLIAQTLAAAPPPLPGVAHGALAPAAAAAAR